MYKDKKAQVEFAGKGKQIYDQHKEALEGKYASHIVAIDVESGEYVVGETLGAANNAMFPKHPDKWIYFVRIGAPEAAIALRTW